MRPRIERRRSSPADRIGKVEPRYEPRYNSGKRRMVPAPPIRTRRRLQSFVRQNFRGRLFVSVSNREPFIHSYDSAGGIQAGFAAGGLTLALHPVMQAVGGAWVAHGSGSADRAAADARGRTRVPPDDPSYTLQRVWLSARENNGYYNGFANQALWPLCHNAFTKPVFREAHWTAYRAVNRKFADAAADLIGGREAAIFIQDYHFALLPRLLRERCPQAVCAHFWHIPWPLEGVFRVCPWKKEILDGLLGNDLLGFHTPEYAERFLDAAARQLDCEPTAPRVLRRSGRETRVGHFPISIDFDKTAAAARGAACGEAVRMLRGRFGLEGKFVVLGLDRIDYSKGVLERLQAVEALLESHADVRGKLVFLYAGAPSRANVPAYRDLHREMRRRERRINRKYGNEHWRPIVTVAEHLPYEQVLALYRLADVCVVSSLDDGMNLVAKEFLAARNDERGRLLLSEFTGAAWELPGAETFNPFAIDEFARRLYALRASAPGAARAQMRRLRRHVRENNVFAWMGSILTQLAALDRTPR